MSIIYQPDHNEGCPPAYGGCTCSCHRMPGVMHCVPCCYPDHDYFEIVPIEPVQQTIDFNAVTEEPIKVIPKPLDEGTLC